MRLATTFLVSAFLSLSTARLHASTHRQSKHASRTLAQRQSPALIDTCVYLNAGAFSNLALLGVPLDLISHLDLCVCLNDLNLFLDTNVQIQLLVARLGRATVFNILSALIRISPGRQQCTYPPHSHHLCTAGNPCAYECDAPYVNVDNSCVCTPPNTMCNGRCGPQACVSSVPRSLKPRSNNIVTFEQAKAKCRPHEDVCGIEGQVSFGFDCVDFESNLQSCGGCVVPHPFVYHDPAPLSQGTDCSKLLGAIDVVCDGGRCSVTRCTEGYEVSSTRDSCIPIGLDIVVDAAGIATTVDTNLVLGLRGLKMRNNKALTTTVDHSGGVLRLDDVVDLVVEYRTRLQTSAPPDTLAKNKARLLAATDALIDATISLITSPTLASVDRLVNAIVLINDELLDGGCADTLGLGTLLLNTENLIGLTSAIKKDWISGNPTTVTVLDASVLLSKLRIPGVGVEASSGELMSGVGGYVNRVLGVLGLGGKEKDGER